MLLVVKAQVSRLALCIINWKDNQSSRQQTYSVDYQHSYCHFACCFIPLGKQLSAIFALKDLKEIMLQQQTIQKLIAKLAGAFLRLFSLTWYCVLLNRKRLLLSYIYVTVHHDLFPIRSKPKSKQTSNFVIEWNRGSFWRYVFYPCISFHVSSCYWPIQKSYLQTAENNTRFVGMNNFAPLVLAQNILTCFIKSS